MRVYVAYNLQDIRTMKKIGKDPIMIQPGMGEVHFYSCDKNIVSALEEMRFFKGIVRESDGYTKLSFSQIDTEIFKLNLITSIGPLEQGA